MTLFKSAYYACQLEPWFAARHKPNSLVGLDSYIFSAAVPGYMQYVILQVLAMAALGARKLKAVLLTLLATTST